MIANQVWQGEGESIEGISKSVWIQDQLRLFTFGGTGTASETLCWICVLLALYPQYQNQIRLELENLKSDHPPTFNQVQKMKFLDAFVKETLRLFHQLLELRLLENRDQHPLRQGIILKFL